MMTIGEILNRKRVFYLLIKDKNYRPIKTPIAFSIVNKYNK